MTIRLGGLLQNFPNTTRSSWCAKDAGGVGTAAGGGTAGATGIGVAATGIGDRAPRVATMHMVWTIPSGLTWLLIAGCAIAAWVVGYGMGYRRGVKDAITGGGIKAKHRINAE